MHLHVRDEEGRPVHRADLYERAIGPIRDGAPDLIVCGTTSGRVSGEIRERMTVLHLDPALRPDMASLTLGSFNFPRVISSNPPEVIEALLLEMNEQGICPEFEVFELGMVNTLHWLQTRGLVRQRPYVNILLGSLGSTPAFVGDLAYIVDRLPDCEWAAAGIGVFQRSMVMAAIAMGGNVRTGLEDAPRDIDGRPSSNVAAVEVAVEAARLAGRPVSTAVEARRRLGLRSR